MNKDSFSEHETCSCGLNRVSINPCSELLISNVSECEHACGKILYLRIIFAYLFFVCLFFLATSGATIPGLKCVRQAIYPIFQTRMKLGRIHRVECNPL